MRSLEKIMNLKTIIFIQTLIFLPFLLQGNIGSDWDSYASFASGRLLFNDGIYIPSRPPGFPSHELLVGIFIHIAQILEINMEQLILSIQFILLISFNYLIYCFFS